jgi:hypothetical protein
MPGRSCSCVPTTGAGPERRHDSPRSAAAANRQKNGPERQSGARLGPSRGRDTARWAPAASARFVAGLWPRRDTFKVPEPRPAPRQFPLPPSQPLTRTVRGRLCRLGTGKILLHHAPSRGIALRRSAFRHAIPHCHRRFLLLTGWPWVLSGSRNAVGVLLAATGVSGGKYSGSS